MTKLGVPFLLAATLFAVPYIQGAHAAAGGGNTPSVEVNLVGSDSQQHWNQWFLNWICNRVIPPTSWLSALCNPAKRARCDQTCVDAIGNLINLCNRFREPSQAARCVNTGNQVRRIAVPGCLEFCATHFDP